MRTHSAPRRFTPARALRNTASMRLVSGTSIPCAKKAYSREIVSQAWRKSFQVFRSAQALSRSFVMAQSFARPCLSTLLNSMEGRGAAARISL